MRLAVHFPSFTVPGAPESLPSIVAATAQAAEAGGCSAFTVMDHYFQMEAMAPAEEPMLEAYATLSYLAGRTQTITLGALVTGVTYRHPGLLAKVVTTLDVLSSGRAMLGLGAAWYDREHRGLGVPFPPLRERYERLEETLQICRQMWSDDNGPYEGKHYRLGETLCSPQPVQQHIPVLIGGSGERRTLPLVARYADACNLFGSSVGEVAHKVSVLRGLCEGEGRSLADIDVTVISSLDPAADPTAFLAEMVGYAGVGVQQVWISARGPDPAGWVDEVCSAVAGELAGLTASGGPA